MTTKWVLPAWTGPGSPQTPVRLPRPEYTHRLCICPDCGHDLDDEGIAGFWCPACQHMWMFSQVIAPGDIDDNQ